MLGVGNGVYVLCDCRDEPGFEGNSGLLGLGHDGPHDVALPGEQVRWCWGSQTSPLTTLLWQG